MLYVRKQQFGNRLVLARYRRALARKTVSALLGHKKTDVLARYERGEMMPSLKTALKLSLIYSAPVTVLFNEFFEMTRQELLEEQGPIRARAIVNPNASTKTDFCSFEENLQSPRPTSADFQKAVVHASRLMRLRSEARWNKTAPIT